MISEQAFCRRKYAFDGSDTEYIRHLEAKVEGLEKHLEQAQSQPLSNASHESDLVFHTENPGTQNAAAIEPATPTSTVTCGVHENAFLARVPACLPEWSKLRKDTLLFTREQLLATFRILTLGSPPVTREFPRMEPVTTPSKVLTAYQNLVEFLRRFVRNSIQLRNYGNLLFFCVCLVGRKNGMEVEDVDKLVRGYLSDFERSSRYLQKLRTTAGLIARAIEQLEVKRGYLGSLLFLISCPSMSTYRRWADQHKIFNHLIDRVTEKTRWLEQNTSACASACVPLSFAPAFLLTYCGLWSLDEVNNGLGTSLSEEDFTLRKQCLEREIVELSRRPAKRQKTTELRDSRSDVPTGDLARQDSLPLEQEAAGGESGRPPSSASSNQSTPTTVETLSADDGGHIPDHAEKASGSQDSANLSNGYEVGPFPADQEQNLSPPQGSDAMMELDNFLQLNGLNHFNTDYFTEWDILAYN